MYKIVLALILSLVAVVVMADNTRPIEVDGPFAVSIKCIEGLQFLFIVQNNCNTCVRPLAVVQILDDNGKPKKCAEEK